MSGLELGVAIALAVWIAFLSLAVVLLVRQVGLLTVRLDRSRDSTAPVDDGLALGSAVPAAVGRALDPADGGPLYVVVLGAICAPCRELAADLGRTQLVDAVSPLLFLISGGSEELADDLAALLPAGTQVLRDPLATEIVNELRVQTTPFAFEIANARIAGKAALRGAKHLEQFVLQSRINGSKSEGRLELQHEGV
jgi:hypothetical protein